MDITVEVLIIVAKTAFILFGVLLHTVLLSIWIERKGSALIQDRIGANRCSILGFDLAGVINTVLADPVKALFKEDWVPKGASQFMHCLGPFLAVFPVLASFAVIPLGPPVVLGGRTITLQLANLNVGILYVLAMGSLAVYGVVLAGWVSNNKFSLFGGLRATAQMISYEVTLGLSFIGLLIIYQTLDPNKIVAAQNSNFLWILPAWGIFLNPIGFLIFFASMMAETKRAPFDLPESESELVAGYLTEYSGMKFLLFWLGEFAEVVVGSALITLLFLGGWHIPYINIEELIPAPWVSLIGAGIFGAKVVTFCVLQVIIRWTLPRFRYDQLMDLCWKLMLPLALVNVMGTAALVLLGFY